MEKFKSLFFKISLVFMLFMSAQYCFATNTTKLVIRKDEPKDPTPVQTNRVENPLPVSATINDTELAVYFDSTVGNATVTVISDSTGTVYQEVVDTGSTAEIFIPAALWSPGTYTLTITYGSTTLRGEFSME
jgi:hypothetical protein